ncbi:MAG: metallophosphoesterase, partial [Pirellula sp.]
MRRRSFLSTASASIAAICIRQELVRAASGKAIRIGLVADPQYADIDTWNTRFYRQSVGKLGEAIAHFNGLELDFCVNLGDLIDKHWQSYDAIFDPLSKSKHTFHHVLGNHDFDLLDEFKPRVPNRMGMPNRYYTWSLDPWVFAFLDTTDVSLYAQAIDKPEYAIANQQLTQLKATGAKNAQSWNSALSTRQIDWFEATCQSAALKNQRIIVFSHHPVFPEN